jgi:DNA-binding beta-propeller fold protein YncE
MLRTRIVSALGLMLAWSSLGVRADALPVAPTYYFIRQIPLPGDNGWDYLSIDEAARRLYVTRADHIDVIDIDHAAVTGTIDDTRGVHGFAIAPQLHQGFASDGQSSQVSIVDLKTRATLNRIPTGTGPDAIVFEPHHQEGYAFNGAGHSLTVFDALRGKVVATVALPGKPEFAAVDADAGRIYVNIEDQNLILGIDTTSHRTVALWQITPGESPSGLAIDTAHHRLFVGCRNQRMLMVDAQNGRVLASIPIGAHVDADVFDPGTQLAFASNGDGTLTIAQESSPQDLTPVQVVRTAVGARTMALDPVTHNVYLVTADFASPAPPAAQSPAQPAAPAAAVRATIVPGSVRVLVYGPK